MVEHDDDDLRTYSGKKQLRKEALQAVQDSLEQYAGEQHIELVLFTKFLMD